MGENMITITMTEEQYEDMVYCMSLVRKQRQKSLDKYYARKSQKSTKESRYKKNIPIPTVSTAEFSMVN
jgi:hypothetical protein